MALKFIDGFEQYSNDANIGSSTQLIAHSSSLTAWRWSAAGGSNASIVPRTSQLRTSQTNSASIEMAGFSSLFMPFPSNTTLIIGFGLRVTGFGYSFLNINSSAVDESTSAGLHFYVTTTGQVRAYNQATNTTVAQSSPVLSAYTWYYIEIKISFSDSTGSVEMRVNGETVASATNVDTLCGLASAVGLNLANSGNGLSHYFDDFYICDTTGTTNNDFLGPISVYTLFPSANGTTNDFTAIGGAGSNYQSVNTEAPNTATYVESNVTNAKDLYQVSDLPISTGTVYGVLVRSYCKKQDNGVRSQQLLIRTSATEANSASMLSTFGSWVNTWAVFEKQADGTTAWDITAVNAMEIGHKNT